MYLDTDVNSYLLERGLLYLHLQIYTILGWFALSGVIDVIQKQYDLIRKYHCLSSVMDVVACSRGHSRVLLGSPGVMPAHIVWPDVMGMYIRRFSVCTEHGEDGWHATRGGG